MCAWGAPEMGAARGVPVPQSARIMLISAASMPPAAAGLCPQCPPGPPPPLLPKPGKDNLRLQKLLRKAARRKLVGGGPSAPPGAFRTSLSPVSEASHDQEAPAPRPAEAPGVAAALPSRPPPTPPGVPRLVSPLRTSTVSLSVTPHRRSLAAHFQTPGPRLATLGPQGCTPVPALTAGGAHTSQVHTQPGPPPKDKTPELPPMGPDRGSGGQDRDPAPCPPGSQPSIPVAHIRPLPAEVQTARPWSEGPPAPRPPSGCQAPGPREASPRVVVPVAPTYRSPGPSPHRPAPTAPHAERPGGPPTVGPAADAGQAPHLQGAPAPALPLGPSPCPAPKVSPKPRLSGWTRLRKQLMEEAREAPSPGPGPELEPGLECPEQQATAPAAPTPRPPASRASRLWDAVLYRMSVAESRSGPAGHRDGVGHLAGLGRLPFLCRPRFNARKLQEAATRPLPGPHAAAGLGLQPKDFNRTAAGWGLR
ncbi:LOW QUALITY PROTEIN: proline-rich protein 33 [Saccopteryx bilineata]|uniref:LOW QUALITY PROTEIN: proline-rich protein 33 n=1 Tax=Saccopteryx bilineata TaxID=59482 RepID=UPI00338FF195